MRANEREQAQKYLDQLRGNPEAEELREKYQKTQVLSKRELKILAALAEKRQAA